MQLQSFKYSSKADADTKIKNQNIAHTHTHRDTHRYTHIERHCGKADKASTKFCWGLIFGRWKRFSLIQCDIEIASNIQKCRHTHTNTQTLTHTSTHTHTHNYTHRQAVRCRRQRQMGVRLDATGRASTFGRTGGAENSPHIFLLCTFFLTA